MDEGHRGANIVSCRIAFVTCVDHPNGSDDDRRVEPALTQLGFSLHTECWDDENVPWQDYAVIIVRSTWDYHLRPAEFARWIARMHAEKVPIHNPPETLAWNMNKRYLLELQAAGVNVVPTAWLSHDRAVDLHHIMQSNGWNKVVVKPAISASAHNTWLCDRTTVNRDEARVTQMLADCDVLVQPFMREVMREGEYSLIFFDGAFSHLVRKLPGSGQFLTQTGKAVHTQLPDSIIAQASAVLQHAPQRTLYARVDGVVQNGQFVLMELELIEPSLFMEFDTAAPGRFADAIGQVAGAGPRLIAAKAQR